MMWKKIDHVYSNIKIDTVTLARLMLVDVASRFSFDGIVSSVSLSNVSMSSI